MLEEKLKRMEHRHGFVKFINNKTVFCKICYVGDGMVVLKTRNKMKFRCNEIVNIRLVDEEDVHTTLQELGVV